MQVRRRAIPSTRNILLAWLAVLFASAIFLVRGPLRARTDYINDFAAPYVSTRLWLHHQNPYDPALFLPTLRAAGAPPNSLHGNLSNQRPVYPPPTLVVLIPLATSSWPAANHALVLLSIAAYLAGLVLFATLIPGTWRDLAKPLFLASGLALAPAHSSLHVTNVACLAASLLFIAIYLLLAEQHRHEVLAALSIALAACLKPSIGLLILPWLLIIRAWRTLAVTLSACALISGVALYRLFQIGPAWRASLDDNLNYVFTQGGVSDLSAQNLTRFDRIDLQPIFYGITHSRTIAGIFACLIAATLLSVWFRLSRQHLPRQAFDRRLLAVASLLVLGLLPFYQRYYSAILLLPAILWAFRNLSCPAARWTLALSAVFLVNTEALLRDRLHNADHGIAAIVLGPHLCWVVLALTCILVAALRGPTSRTT